MLKLSHLRLESEIEGISTDGYNKTQPQFEFRIGWTEERTDSNHKFIAFWSSICAVTKQSLGSGTMWHAMWHNITATHSHISTSWWYNWGSGECLPCVSTSKISLLHNHTAPKYLLWNDLVPAKLSMVSDSAGCVEKSEKLLAQ